MSFAEKIQQELTAAMKAREELRLRVLRMLKTALHNRKIERGAELDDPESLAVVKSLIKQRREAAEAYRKGGAADRAAEEEKEIGVLENYLPVAVGDDAIRAAIDAAVKETAATSAKDMGKVMKAVMAALAGKTVDGKKVSEAVKARLA